MKKGGDRMKDANVTIRLSQGIKDRLKEKAKEQGMAVSEYVRYLIMKDLETK